MGNPHLEKLDAHLIRIDEELGQLHAWLDNPTEIDLDRIKTVLAGLQIPEDQRFLEKKRRSLLTQAMAMGAANTRGFTGLCIGYFENLVPTDMDIREAKEVFTSGRSTPMEFSSSAQAVSVMKAAEVAERIKVAIKDRDLEGVVKVVFPYGQGGTVSIQSYLTRPSEIRIGPNVEKNERQVEKTIAHEIEGHLYRSLNGRRQFPRSAFYSGTSGGYLLAEEGFTNQIESLRGITSNDKIPAAHVIAVDDMLHGATQVEIRSLLLDYGLTERQASSVAKRSKRGVASDDDGGYVGGAAYFLGRKRVGKFLEDGGKLLTLSVGKIGLEEVPLVEQMLNDGELTPAKYKV